LTYELKGTNGILEITAGNRTALWNGLNLELGFVPHLTNGQPFLHKLDLAKTFEPLTFEPALLHRTNRTVVLDPGHGGENYGAKSVVNNRYEKEYALDWAFRTEKLLKAKGWKVYLTRTNDADISLADRVAFADNVQADLFVSLHFNSTDQPQGRAEQGGLETYCLTPVGMPSTLTRNFNDEPGHIYPNNAFDADNYYFATRIHRALVQTTQRKDRGVRRARFMGILRGQNRPAVLLEGGYLTLPAEARLIGSPEFRQKLAEAVARGLEP
jgi:N-acetylmuramoyl-L-alanine amidase